ncbi:MAG: IclR family transcriptional regulator [Rubrobacteraceae bacterium]|nr:IclR family transcriptional regulator [Rubrobacteraceae bacterium]
MAPASALRRSLDKGGDMHRNELETSSVDVAGESQKGEKSARRVLKVLKLIGEYGGEITAKEIARLAGVSLPTAYNLINALIREGYVERVPGRRGYRLGPMISVLYQRSLGGSDITLDIEPVLKDLAERSGQRAYLAVRQDGRMVILDIKSIPGAPRLPDVCIGFGDGSHALAIGKVLLAYSDEKDMAEEEGTLCQFTSRTIISPRKLESELTQVRAQEFAMDLDEFAEGFCCVAAPVRNAAGEVEASVGISVPSRHFYSKPRYFLDMIRVAGREASGIRGYRYRGSA